VRFDKKPPLKSDKKVLPKTQKKGSIGYNKKSALLEDAITQMNAGKYGRASSALKDLLALDPLNAEARRLFATLHLRLGSLMSARTAFESLAREAMERQDYWLAESLLREYLTAGPRYVPFLDMLGHVYEEKGDVMAAVAEYGKAVEVLLEDPDAEKPNRPSELFARIRALAPGSPVAFRLAAMFDTVTGQVLQATPQPTTADVASEPAVVETVPDSSVESAGLMPWEQMDLPPTVPVSPGVTLASAAEPSTEALEAIAPPVLPDEAASVMSQPEMPPEVPVPAQAVDSDAKREQDVSIEPAPVLAVGAAEPVELLVHDLSSVSDKTAAPTEEMALPVSPVADVPQSVIAVHTEPNPHPIAQAPAGPKAMPWDQVEEDVAAIAPLLSPPEASVAGEASAPTSVQSTESAIEPTSTVDPVPPVLEVLARSGSHPIAEVPKAPAPMPWDQVEEAAILIPPPTEPSASATGESDAVPAVEPETASAPAETTPPTIEVLTQTSSQPIAQTPTSPASMPWDQVQEETRSTSVTAELTGDSLSEGSTLLGETAVAPPSIDSAVTSEQATGQARSEVTSSGMTWDEILAAVAAMQAPTEPASPQVHEPSVPVSDQAPADPSAPVLTDSADGVHATKMSADVPASEPVVESDLAARSLSAPMPWEQIEVEPLTIPREEAEAEGAPVTAEAAGVEQEPTVVLPAAPELSEPVATDEIPEQEVVVASALDAYADAASEGRIVSPDVPIEPQQESTLLPVEAQQTIDEARPDLLPEGVSKEDQLSTVTGVQPAEPAFRLAENTTLMPTVAEAPPPVSMEPVTEFALAEGQQTSMEMSSSEAVSPVVESVDAMVVQEIVELAPIEMSSEGTVSPDLPEPWIEPIAAEVEETVVQPQASAEPVRPPVSESEFAPVLAQESMPLSEADSPLQAPTGEPLAERIECVPVPMDSIQQPSAVAEIQTAPMAPVEESVPALMPVESVDGPEPVGSAGVTEVTKVELPADSAAFPVPEESTPATRTPSEPEADDRVKLLWEDASSAPPAAASSGNLLSRWFKKSAAPVPVDTSAAAEVAPSVDEPTVSEASLPSRVEVHGEIPAPPMEEPAVEPVAEAAPVVVDEIPQRPTISRPAGTPIWSRAGEAVGSLVGAGLSTTRSFVVMVMALVGLVLFLAGGTVAAVALMWLVLEEQPSAAYRTMTSVPQQMLQDSTKNGYFLLLGLGASSTQDPVQVGMDRRVEGADQAFTHTCLSGEGAGTGGEHSAAAEAAAKWIKASDPAVQMSQNAGGVKALVSQNEVGLARYRQWLSKPFEDEGYGKPISPNCTLILQTHRLYVAEGFAQDVETGVARLETDLTAWRTVLGQAKTMPMKLLAAAAMNDDIAVMGGLLQRPDLDERQIGRLAKLARPLEPAEQSIRWPIQSQFVLATNSVEEAISRDRAATRPFYGAVAAVLPLPKQRRFNAYAEYYDLAGKAAADGRYADLPKQSHYVHAPPYGVSDVVLNPIESLVGVDPLPTWEAYAGRVLETDARLRLASLQAWLRRTPSDQDLLTRLAKAGQGVYDPFTGLPMLVNLKKGVLYSVGPDLKDDEAHERLDLVAKIPSVAWNGGKKGMDQGAAK
jgi:hypothetical protein